MGDVEGFEEEAFFSLLVRKENVPEFDLVDGDVDDAEGLEEEAFFSLLVRKGNMLEFELVDGDLGDVEVLEEESRFLFRNILKEEAYLSPSSYSIFDDSNGNIFY